MQGYEFTATSAADKFYNNYNGPLFKSEALKNFEILSSFPGWKQGMKLPAEIRTEKGHPTK